MRNRLSDHLLFLFILLYNRLSKLKPGGADSAFSAPLCEYEQGSTAGTSTLINDGIPEHREGPDATRFHLVAELEPETACRHDVDFDGTSAPCAPDDTDLHRNGELPVEPPTRHLVPPVLQHPDLVGGMLGLHDHPIPGM